MAGLFSPQLMGPSQSLMMPQQAQMPQQATGLRALLGGGGSERSLRLRDLLAPEIALPMAGAMMMGETPQESFGGALQFAGLGLGERKKERKASETRNKTAALLRKTNPELLPWLEAEAISPADAFAAVQASGKRDLTNDLQHYEVARQQGFQGSLMDFMTAMKKAGADNISIGGQQDPMWGNAPTDQVWLRDNNGQVITEPDPTGRGVRPVSVPISGSKADMEAQAAGEKGEMRMGAALTASDTVTTAASRAREAVGNQNFGPAGTSAVAGIPVVGPMTDSAEVMRQTDVLKSLAAAENLNAMRQSSPTGGALGNVTEKELKLLQDKSGALDPNSPNFLRDLEDYERTLLRTIHGREVGDAIFEQTRGGEGWTDLGNGVRIRRK